MRMLSLVLGALLAATLTLIPTEAHAWTRSANFKVWRGGYQFTKVIAKSGTLAHTKCMVEITVQFKAPTSAYSAFRARVRFKRGAWVRTPVFNNRIQGKRQYTYSWDTSKDGCWAARPQKPDFLTVSSCHQPGCTPAPIQ